jgi:predicted site-specific integrase-resolvase
VEKEAMEVGKEKFRERDVEWNMEEVITSIAAVYARRSNGEKRVRVY